jgi:hypothetical protein
MELKQRYYYYRTIQSLYLLIGTIFHQIFEVAIPEAAREEVINEETN